MLETVRAGNGVNRVGQLSVTHHVTIGATMHPTVSLRPLVRARALEALRKQIITFKHKFRQFVIFYKH